MPHLRPRHATALIKQLKNHSPIVGILGHRQVGKTTLLEGLSNHYYSLDSKKELDLAILDPEMYIDSRAQGWVALDECQNAPSLFPAMKEKVRMTKGKPGQFLLSGSVRFTGSPHIRESLTGRITNVELLPLSIRETEEYEPSDVVAALLEMNIFEERNLDPLVWCEKGVLKKRRSSLDVYQSLGGLPGICFIRDPKIRNERIRSSLETILDRDLRQIVRTNLPYQSLLATAKYLAYEMGTPLDFSKMSRDLDVSTATLKKIVYALENVFVIRLIKAEGSRRGFGYFFEDLAESSYLSQFRRTEDHLAHALWMNIRAALSYRMGTVYDFFQFFSRSGYIPICIKKDNSILGVICMKDVKPSKLELGLTDSFLKHYRNSKVCLVHVESKPMVLTPRISILRAVDLI